MTEQQFLDAVLELAVALAGLVGDTDAGISQNR